MPVKARSSCTTNSPEPSLQTKHTLSSCYTASAPRTEEAAGRMLPKSGSLSPWQYHNRATARHRAPTLREINLSPRDLTWQERTLAAESARAGAPRARQPRGCRYQLAGSRPRRDSIAWEWQPPHPWGCGHRPHGTSFLGVGLSRANHHGDKGRSVPLPGRGRAGRADPRQAPRSVCQEPPRAALIEPPRSQAGDFSLASR